MKNGRKKEDEPTKTQERSGSTVEKLRPSRDATRCRDAEKCRRYQHEFEDLLLRAALLQEEAVRVRALEDTPRLQQLTHAVLDEASVRRRAVA